MIEETIKLFSSELSIKPERSRVIVNDCVYQTRMHSVHFTLRLWQNGPLHHSYCCKGEVKLSLLYLSGFSGSLLWFSLGRKGAAVAMESKAEKVIVFFHPGMFKMVLVLALLRTLFFFFFLCLSLDTPSPFFLVCLLSVIFFCLVQSPPTSWI